MPGKRLNSQARDFVAKLIVYFTSERDNKGPLISLNAVQERVAAALQISTRTVASIKIRSDKNELLSTPGKSRPRKQAKTHDLSESSKMDVRNTLYDMYAQKKHVTINNLRKELRQKEIINVSYGTLRTLLLDLGFKFKKDDNRRALMETPRICSMRAAFLRKYMENKNAHIARQLVFIDETWIFSKGSQRKSWQDDNIKSVRKPGGFDGKRFIVLHAGHSGGFVENANLLFASKSKSLDYHGEMNSEMFTKWVRNQLIPNLEEPSLIIMDNASYHSVEVEKQPSSAWKKEEILEWLQKNSLPHNKQMFKTELLDIAKAHKKSKEYQIDKIFQEHGHEVLRLPPYHCQFNAIELIWANAKTFYNKHIGEEGYGDKQVLQMWNRALEKCTPEVWHASVQHTENLIQQWYDREVIIEEIPEIIIRVGNDESESEESTSSD